MSNKHDWEKITLAVENICGFIFKTTHDVLKSVGDYGLENLLFEPKPNAEDKLLQIKIFESLFTQLITYFEKQDKNDLVMKLLNAKQQILHLEMLINSVKSSSFEDCERLIELLSTQATI